MDGEHCGLLKCKPQEMHEVLWILLISQSNLWRISPLMIFRTYLKILLYFIILSDCFRCFNVFHITLYIFFSYNCRLHFHLSLCGQLPPKQCVNNLSRGASLTFVDISKAAKFWARGMLDKMRLVKLGEKCFPAVSRNIYRGKSYSTLQFWQ